MGATVGRVFINLRHGRALVSRYVPFERDMIGWETASNADDLEDAALAYLTSRYTSVCQNRHYECPRALALQAHFEWRREL